MPTYQFEAEVGPDRTIRIPTEVPVDLGPVTITLNSPTVGPKTLPSVWLARRAN